MKRPSQAVTAILCTVAALSVFLIPIEVSPAAFKALAVTVWMVLFWIFSPIDHAITGLVGCFLYWATGAVNFETAFSGFSQDTSWFLFGAIIFGTMATQTGLALRLAYSVMSVIGISYALSRRFLALPGGERVERAYASSLAKLPRPKPSDREIVTAPDASAASAALVADLQPA